MLLYAKIAHMFTLQIKVKGSDDLAKLATLAEILLAADLEFADVSDLALVSSLDWLFDQCLVYFASQDFSSLDNSDFRNLAMQARRFADRIEARFPTG
jgi:hypothetical protein